MELQGTNVAAGIVPFTDQDSFPTHYPRYGAGSLMTGINSIAERDAIPADRRELYMQVPIAGVVWTLTKGLTNADWELLKTTGIEEPIADGKPYMRMRGTGQDVGQWYESTAKIPMRQGIEYTGTYYEVYMDAENGDDNTPNPNDPATPIKTLDAAVAFIKVRDFFGGYVRFRFKSGIYNITTNNSFIPLGQFNSCGITQIYLQSESYISNSAYDETVILPKISFTNTIVGISIGGVKIRNIQSNSISITGNSPVTVSLYDCAIESNNTMVSPTPGAGRVILTRVKLIPSSSIKNLISLTGGAVRITDCSVENTVNVTDATVVSTSGTIEVNTGFISGLDLVTGNKVNITGGGSIIYSGNVAGTDPTSLIPGSTYGFNGRSTDFSNPDNLENAPTFITDGYGGKILADNGQYVDNIARIPVKRGVDYTGTYYDIFVDAANGDDNTTTPTDQATPFKALTAAIQFLQARTFYGALVRIIFKPGTYTTNYNTSNNIFNTKVFTGCDMGGIRLYSYTVYSTPNTLDETVRLSMRISSANPDMSVICYGLLISPPDTDNSVPLYASTANLSLNYCAISGNACLGTSYGAGYLVITNSKFRPKKSSTPYLFYSYTNSTLVFSGCSVENAITVTETFMKANTQGIIVITADFTGDPNIVTGKKYSFETGAVLHKYDTVSKDNIPGSIAGTECFGTSFANPQTIEKFSESSGQLLWDGNPVGASESDPTVPGYVKEITTSNVSNWNNAYSNSHNHSNKAVLDGITSSQISNWNMAYGYSAELASLKKLMSGDPTTYTFSSLDVTTGYGVYYVETNASNVTFPNFYLWNTMEYGRDITIYWKNSYSSTTLLNFPLGAEYDMVTGAGGNWTMGPGAYYIKVFKAYQNGQLTIMVLPKPQWS